MKKFFKYRRVNLRWFTFYLFPRENYSIGIGFWPEGDGDYALFYIKLLIIEMDVTFAPNSWFKKPDKVKDEYDWNKKIIR